MCAFRVMHHRQGSLAKESSINICNVIPQKAETSSSQMEWDGVIKPPSYNFDKFETKY